ncbi:MAG TPA: PAS domain S-box protein [Tepidisphaeraceae bacterium]|jgi:PAS domain S-box-containing protein|nr:PAS domain S-box protein [Tepidisphaeraceae bacterium]
MDPPVIDSDNSSLEFLRTSNLIGFVRMQSDGVFAEANNAFLELVGYSRAELVGKMTWRDVTSPEYFDVSMQAHQRVLRTGTTDPIEKDYLRKDGKRITVLIGSVRARGDDVVGFILDITQRKANERALADASAMLRRSESRFRRLMDANVIGVGFFHVDGRFLDANDALLNIAGMSRADLEAGRLRWDHLTPPEYRHLDERAVEQLRTTGKCVPYEKEYIRADGRRVAIVIAAAFLEGSPDEGFAFVLDNSARKAAEKALQEAHRSLMHSEERFRLAVVHSPDTMYFQDAGLHFTWLSRVFPPFQMEDVVGKTDFDFGPPAQARRLIETKQRVMRTGKGERVQATVEIAGKPTYFETALEPRLDDAGKVIGVAGYLRNMTKWREKELELSQANVSLEQMRQTLEQRVAERTAELALSESRLRESEEHQRKIAEHNLRLVREVEHRVRNHLANLVGLVQVMREKATDVRQFADAIEGRLRAMAHVHQVLAAEGWDAVGLQSLIESTLASLSYMSPHACDVSVAGRAVPITALHALPLALILAEWFTNSIKYGSCGVEGGKVEIHWTLTERAEKGTQSWVTLTWSESAGPPITGTVTASLGTALVQGFATQELSGECESSYPPEGARHVLRFPSNGEG